MSRSGFPSLLRSEDALYAWREPRESLHARWGKRQEGGGEGLSFRKFHFPRRPESPLWRDFPDTGTFAFSEAGSFDASGLPAGPPLPKPASSAQDDRAAWNELCRRAAAKIAEGRARKLVLARQTSFSLSPEERAALLEGLYGRLFAPLLENSYRFLVKSGSSVFFGATPELLFRREGGKLFVPAIAGTRSLASGAAAALQEELLTSAKDRAEHEWVVKGIRESLESLGLRPIIPREPEALRVPGLLHLYTPVTADDLPSLSGDELMEALHPTPAIGGHPKEAAKDFLLTHEGWDRGLFSAPLLFRSPGRELCLVAIRSALLTADQVHFFAGAGYVEGSSAALEWEETERKLQVMQSILFGDPHG